jgi:hypothetical protein
VHASRTPRALRSVTRAQQATVSTSAHRHRRTARPSPSPARRDEHVAATRTRRRRTDPRVAPSGPRSMLRTSCHSAASEVGLRARPDLSAQRRARRANHRSERDAMQGLRARAPHRASSRASHAGTRPTRRSRQPPQTQRRRLRRQPPRTSGAGGVEDRRAQRCRRGRAFDRKRERGRGVLQAGKLRLAALAGAQVLLEPLPLVQRQRIDCVGRREGMQVVGHSAPKPYSHAGRVRFGYSSGSFWTLCSVA